ncbi:MAG: hypothetical protein PHY16_00595 [Methylobacter sp.]|nr:hypothetical protein [Methylobacter sp.]
MASLNLSLEPGFMRGFPAPHPNGVNANPLLADWSGTNSSGTNLHLPEGRQAGVPDVTPCRNDDIEK